MNRVNKSRFPPPVKFVQRTHRFYNYCKWRVFTVELCKDYDSKGVVQFTEDEKYNAAYGYSEYRDALINDIGHKCVFCERPIDKGEIEHFRPKAEYRDNNKNSTRPGYYWLAYNWKNMLISCHECNIKKGVNFPLIDESKRVTTRSGNINLEEPYYIDPSNEDPSAFVTFNMEVPSGIDQTGRGQKIIDDFGLEERYDLKSGRETAIARYKDQYKLYELSLQGIDVGTPTNEIENTLNSFLDLKHPFSGMIRENIRNGFLSAV